MPISACVMIRNGLRARAVLGFAGAFTMISVAAPAAAAQELAQDDEPAAMDTTSLGGGPYARMHALLEKTIFKVDVLTLEVRFGTETSGRLEELIGDRSHSPDLADSVAAVAVQARDAWARIEFKRGVSLDQFVDGSLDNVRRAREQGIISSEDYETVYEGLPRWFAFLEERRIHRGDQIVYRIRGDTLRTASGEILLDQTDIGPERRLSVLGAYFARKSDFAKRLVKSLFVSVDSDVDR